MGNYNKNGVQILEDLILYTKSISVPLILCSIPSKKGLRYIEKQQKEFYHQKQLKEISLKHNIRFFDMYQLFNEIGAGKVISDYYLKKDGHWNQMGSDLFAHKLAEKINLNDIKLK